MCGSAPGELVISIHALRGEGDLYNSWNGRRAHYFNPRPPWGGRLGGGQGISDACSYFSPRPPWGGRREVLPSKLKCQYFNPRPPWGGRRFFRSFPPTRLKFQSTPSVGRATLCKTLQNSKVLAFQSTPSVGRATRVGAEDSRGQNISIHALRGEGDRWSKAAS